MAKEKTLKQKMLDYVFITAKQPVLLKDLLVANRQFNEGMDVDASRLGFKLSLTKAYILYTSIILGVLVPLSFLTHKELAKIDSHISIIGAVVITAAIFIGFNYFKDWLICTISKNTIRKAWAIHFPFFPYNEYSTKIEEIFEQSLKDEITKKDLEKYILDNLAD